MGTVCGILVEAYLSVIGTIQGLGRGRWELIISENKTEHDNALD